MDGDEDGEKNTSESKQPTMEEMRKRRLAYFGVSQSVQKQAVNVNEWEIQNPWSISQDAQNKQAEYPETSLAHQLDMANEPSFNLRYQHRVKLTPMKNNPSTASNDFETNSKLVIEKDRPIIQKDLLTNTGRYDFINDEPKPLKSKRSPDIHNSVDRDLTVFKLRDSQEDEGLSVFKSHPDLDDLGFSTHRPESETSARVIQGELFIPTDRGSAKTTRQIFSDKVEDEIRSALGDEKMEQLLIKVNNDIGKLHHLNESPARSDKSRECNTVQNERNSRNLSRSSSADSVGSSRVSEERGRGLRSRAESQSPHRRPVMKVASSSVQEGEREVPTLVRNYDQVTVPRNTRNSFSSEEIYRRAYGGYQEPATYSVERLPLGRRSVPNVDYNSVESQIFPLSSRSRKASFDNPNNNAAASVSHFQNNAGIGAIPISSSVSSSHFDLQQTYTHTGAHNNTSNPHSSQTSFRGQPPIFMQPQIPYSHHHPYYSENSGNPLYNAFIPQSPTFPPQSSMASTSNPFYYSSPLSSSPFGVPHFAESASFHMHHPPTPHQVRHHGPTQATPFESMPRRNSFTAQGHPAYTDEVRKDFCLKVIK